MLSRKTTFIVGAGASKSYGLPIAGELYRVATKLAPNGEVYQLLLCCSIVQGLQQQRRQIEPEILNGTVADLKNHGGPSIDQFIQHRQLHATERAEIGKLLLAALLGRAIKNIEKPEQAPSDDDWIAKVIQIVSAGLSSTEFAATVEKNLNFVTFNFDSLIELRARARIREVYLGQPDVQAAVESLTVHHVHGRLNEPPKEPLQIGDASRSGYTASGISYAWVDWTEKAAESIHLTQDEIQPETLESVRATVKNADVLCFLGFRYEDDNLSKLGFPECLRNRTLRNPNGRVTLFGSCFEMPNGERQRLESICLPTEIQLGVREGKCLRLLADYYVLQYSRTG